ncbi:hypothetical protein cyc_03969 [Cyclospora cayetanensis]|uniref:Uncharacterized protein n=1 Tax=Cyclospora cayetanensis TaxID=88456 RepID=A0A1D3D1A7_9EIME|nr:hypothetical protein cyc_03969 [Cyclospora cayetanensis]
MAVLPLKISAMIATERRNAEDGFTQKQQRPDLEGDTVPRGVETPGEPSRDKFAAGGLVRQYTLQGGVLFWRPSRLDMVLHDLERRLECQRLLANPRDILRCGGGDKGDYYDKDDAFIDDTEMFGEFGLDPNSDFASSSSEDGDEEEGRSKESLDRGAFVCRREILPAEASDSDGGVSGEDDEEDEALIDPRGWRAFRPRLRVMLEQQQLSHLEELEATLQKIPERVQGAEAVAELESIAGRYVSSSSAAVSRVL